MVKIAFYDNSLSERGTSIAVFDYAYYNKHLLHNESIIIYDNTRTDNHPEVIDKFKKEFDVFGVYHFSQVDQLLIEQKCDIIYAIKYGTNDNIISKVTKTVVHCAFNCTQPHGDAYLAISPCLFGYHEKIPILPHMINLPNTDRTMRTELNIPEDATVFGRHGGKGEFDILEVQQIVYQYAQEHPTTYFLFLNTNPFCPELPNIIHIPTIIDLEKKVEFINTCDAMIWARYRGETFGLSIGEFSSKNKPVLCKKGYEENEHIRILGDKCILYTNNNLYDILGTFERKAVQQQDWNAYTDYTPEKVMKIFQNLCIDPFITK